MDSLLFYRTEIYRLCADDHTWSENYRPFFQKYSNPLRSGTKLQGFKFAEKYNNVGYATILYFCINCFLYNSKGYILAWF
jgi:hypothetical protein